MAHANKQLFNLRQLILIMDWDGLYEEVKKLRESIDEPKVIPTENPTQTDNPEALADTEKKWWQISDIFSRNDEMLEAILEQLKNMAALQVTPQLPTDIEPVLPTEVTGLLNNIALNQNRTKELLEGFNFTTNQAQITAPGTRLELIAGTKTYLIIVRATTTNTGNIYVGGTGVTAQTGFILGPGEAISIQIDASKRRVFIDGDVAGEGVSWIMLTDRYG